MLLLLFSFRGSRGFLFNILYILSFFLQLGRSRRNIKVIRLGVAIFAIDLIFNISYISFAFKANAKLYIVSIFIRLLSFLFIIYNIFIDFLY